VTTSQPEDSTADPFQIVAPLPQAHAWLPLGQVRPRGWIARQMRHDLEHGFVGHLDDLVPSLIRDDDIYGANRLSLSISRKELGVVGEDAAWHVQYLWWNSETQSNWRDGMIRSALLLDHPASLARAHAYVEQILATQEADGYLGIYGPDLRYSLRGENGELWAQASLFRVLLGYYEATGEARVLEAVERAAKRTMAAYPQGQSQPFAVERPYAGLAHGLTFTDALDRLAQLTGDQRYAEYALWLYAEYSGSETSQEDIRYTHLRDPDYRFEGHGVHTYEHLRALLTAAYVSGSPSLQRALESYLAKLDLCLTPSGGPIGDEWIGGREADPASTGYEYCSIHELLDSYTQLLQKSGAAIWGDRAEWLIFNAGQGARHPERSAIAYLKTDTSTAMTGTLRPSDADDPAHPQTRYKYSSAHQDVAVCCVPNAGRIYPYYVRAMWMRRPDGLAACLYGSCELNASIDGVALRIVETTDYPLDLGISLRIEAAQPISFTLAMRRPAWASGYTCVLDGQAVGEEADGWISVRRTWLSSATILLRFEATVRAEPTRGGDLALRHGPLLYVRPITGQERPGRDYPLPGFSDIYVDPDPHEVGVYQLSPVDAAGFQHTPGARDPERPWLSGPTLSGPLHNPQTGQTETVRLVPIGASVLRQATFPQP
jgi:hypothetical protein